ncbi:MAG: acyl carrier protein [Clostridia bacterium]|nr:acyl carrier protein [Clostridia bacterium]
MFDKLKALLVEEFDIDAADIQLTSDLSQDLGINSVELMDLAMRCEEEFDIQFPDDDIHEFTTVGDIVKFLENAKA